MAMPADQVIDLVGLEREPFLPHGRRIELPNRGTTFVREVAGPPGAPTLLLLHGWIASAGLNWFQSFESLGRHFNVLAPDLRGHARGLRSRRVFRLADCADDCAEMLLQLGTGPVIAVGYSLGGPVAQLFWRRHRDLCAGLVLCATAATFIPGSRERIIWQSMTAAAASTTRLGRFVTRLPGVPRVGPFPSPRPGNLPAWAAAEMRRHDWRMIIEAGHSIGTYDATRWIGEVDVPTSVVVTTEDRGVSPILQMETADAIAGAKVFPHADGHVACARRAFTETLVSACRDTADRCSAQFADAGNALGGMVRVRTLNL